MKKNCDKKIIKKRNPRQIEQDRMKWRNFMLLGPPTEICSRNNINIKNKKKALQSIKNKEKIEDGFFSSNKRRKFIFFFFISCFQCWEHKKVFVVVFLKVFCLQ